MAKYVLPNGAVYYEGKLEPWEEEEFYREQGSIKLFTSHNQRPPSADPKAHTVEASPAKPRKVGKAKK